MTEIITLHFVTETLENAHYRKAETTKDVFADRRSVTRSEFYQSYQAGLQAEAVFRVYEAELGDAAFVSWNGNKYKIIRRYPLDRDRTEITVGEQIGAPAANSNGGADDGAAAD